MTFRASDRVEDLRQLVEAVAVLDLASRSNHDKVIDPDLRKAIIVERTRLYDEYCRLAFEITEKLGR